MLIKNKAFSDLNYKIEEKTRRHYLKGRFSLLDYQKHTTFYTQLAIDADETEMLTRVSEKTFYKFLVDYFNFHNISLPEEKLDTGCKYYSSVGLGKMKINSTDSKEVILTYADIDKEWLERHGPYSGPVNYITCGYICALFSAVLEKSPGTFKAIEVESIVMGAEKSRFKVQKV